MMALSMEALGVVIVSERKSKAEGPGCCQALTGLWEEALLGVVEGDNERPEAVVMVAAEDFRGRCGIWDRIARSLWNMDLTVVRRSMLRGGCTLEMTHCMAFDTSMILFS